MILVTRLRSHAKRNETRVTGRADLFGTEFTSGNFQKPVAASNFFAKGHFFTRSFHGKSLSFHTVQKFLDNGFQLFLASSEKVLLKSAPRNGPGDIEKIVERKISVRCCCRLSH